jgi:hypothetical protein
MLRKPTELWNDQNAKRSTSADAGGVIAGASDCCFRGLGRHFGGHQPQLDEKATGP